MKWIDLTTIAEADMLKPKFAPSQDECIDSHDFISATDIPPSVFEWGDSVLEGSTDGDPTCITAIV